MARSQIRYLPEAVDELREASDWYRAHGGEQLLERWRRAVREILNSIRATPTLWAADRQGIRAVLVPRFSYKIVYHFHRGTVEVVAFAQATKARLLAEATEGSLTFAEKQAAPRTERVPSTR